MNGKSPRANVAPGAKKGKPDALISYNSEDKAEVMQLVSRLEKLGVTTWVDREQLKPGVRWMEEIGRAMNKVKRVLVILGPHGIGSFQREEINQLIAQNRSDNRNVIPVLLPGAKKLPSWLAIRQHVDLRADASNALERLALAIKPRTPIRRSLR